MFDKEKETFLFWLSTKLEPNYRRKTLAKLFAVGVIGNVLAWLIALFTPNYIGKFVSALMILEGKVGIYLLVIPFSFAFLMAFSICKLRTNRRENLTKQQKDFLDNYFDELKTNDYRIIFLISAMSGGLNAILLVFAVVTFQ